MELRRPNPNTNIQLPPGFRFHPSDEELIVHYLKNKALSRPVPASIVADIDLYKYNPWELPMKALFGEDEWYFFTPRDRKYPNGSRPNRAAASGYWKATGTDKPILTSSGLQSIGVKKALVFYKGSPPKGTKTNWIMHEYRLLDSMIKPSKSRGSMRLDDCVLCRVRQKDNLQRSTWESAGQNNSDTVVNNPNFGFMEMADHGETLSINSSSAEPSFEIVANYLINNDCPLLACILASHQGVPGRIIEQSITDQYSNLNFQGGSSSTSTSPDQQKQYYCYSSVLEDKSEDVGSSQITDHSNSLKRKIKSNINIDGYHGLPGSSYENIVTISSPTKKQEGIRNSSVFSFSDDQQYYLPVQDHSIFNPNASNKIPFMGRDELQ